MVEKTNLKNVGAGYVSPAVEVIEVETEQGFATSGQIGGTGADYPIVTPYSEEWNNSLFDGPDNWM